MCDLPYLKKKNEKKCAQICLVHIFKENEFVMFVVKVLVYRKCCECLCVHMVCVFCTNKNVI